MYKIELDSTKKALKATVSGMLSKEDIKNYLEEMTAHSSKINPKDYSLIIDAREQKTLTQDSLPYAEKVMKFYAETPFAKRFSVVLSSSIAMSQANRVSKNEVELFEMVTSVDEAYRKI